MRIYSLPYAFCTFELDIDLVFSCSWTMNLKFDSNFIFPFISLLGFLVLHNLTDSRGRQLRWRVDLRPLSFFFLCNLQKLSVWSSGLYGSNRKRQFFKMLTSKPLRIYPISKESRYYYPQIYPHPSSKVI